MEISRSHLANPNSDNPKKLKKENQKAFLCKKKSNASTRSDNGVLHEIKESRVEKQSFLLAPGVQLFFPLFVCYQMKVANGWSRVGCFERGPGSLPRRFGIEEASQP